MGTYFLLEDVPPHKRNTVIENIRRMETEYPGFGERKNALWYYAECLKRLNRIEDNLQGNSQMKFYTAEFMQTIDHVASLVKHSELYFKKQPKRCASAKQHAQFAIDRLEPRIKPLSDARFDGLLLEVKGIVNSLKEIIREIDETY